MKQCMRTSIRLGLLFLLCLIPMCYGFCQIYSKGINDNAKTLGFLELKIIEIDPVIKQAKETVPFDNPFYLKIKRRTLAPTKTQTVTNTNVVPAAGGNPVTTTTIKEEKAVLNPPPAPASINAAYLSRLDNTGAPTGLVAPFSYQESSNSEYIYIQINNVRPEHGYKLSIHWNDGGAVIEDYFFTTVAGTLDKRLKNKISPQIGVASPYFILPNNRLYAPPRLMVGAYYQFRPIDPDIPFKSYHPLALQRFSAYLGLTFNTLSDNYIREDLFGTSNLLFGIGYQPMDALRITGGQLMFTQLDPNRILAERKSIASTFYLGITLDVKLKDLLGGIITTLGFK